jgi:predicted TIM-barrel fold metal-dependent hydrolase
MQAREVCDNHVHLFNAAHEAQLLRDLDYTGTTQFALMVIGRDPTWDPQGNQLENCLRVKQKYPDRAFVFGGFDFRSMIARGVPEVPFDEQLKQLLAIGCDGLKLLIGKPDVLRQLRHPLDGPLFEPFLALAEELQVPVLWHVADPPEFWSEATVPLWARGRGWSYENNGYPTKSLIEMQMSRVFSRHPRLNLILPHFCFLSDRLDDAAFLLNHYPSYCLDLAPGVEMFHNFTANWDASRAFFINHADRILYGTDFGMGLGWHKDRGMMIQRFLETTDTFDVPNDPLMQPDERPALRGLDLPEPVLQKIYVENFRRVIGTKPKPLNLAARTEWMIAG